jgi:photosystem II stability/assembly factor-like uncharacterized protein
MKRLFIVFVLFFATIYVQSQNWVEEFYSTKSIDSEKSLDFYATQKIFNNYWENFNLKNGYYYIDGQKHKAAGWKQFKRWEWFWETRINRKTGEIPSVNTFDIHRVFFSTRNSKADLSNWQNMGPNSSEGGYAGIGRINCIAFHPTNANVFWAGAPSGGLWKTTNGGSSWTVLTDKLPVLGVSDIVIPTDYETSKTLYIATGDRDAGDNYSIGVLKSTDDGINWVETGLKFNVSSRYRITRMIVHPTKQNILFVATNGGIFKSVNSGDTWDKIQNGLFFDMEFQYRNEDNVLFAVTADYWGSPKVYKTSNGGVYWSEVYAFPTSAYRVELAVSKSNPTIVYALVSTTTGGMDGIYKSINNGDTFTKIYDGTISGKNLLNWSANSSDTGGQGWYDLTLSVSPNDENLLFLGGINAWKSTTGGISWSIINHWYGAGGVPAVHADKHYMVFYNQNTFFEANDGGIYKTTNGGTNWIDLTNDMEISQMYKLGVSQTVKDEVITGLQDNGSKLTSSGYWYDVKGGDGMECLIDYSDVNVQYATYVNGQIDRTTDRWSNYYTVVDITANIPGGAKGAWVTPYLIDPKDNKTIYVGYEDVWKTTNRGDSWTKISSLVLTNKIRSMAIAPSDSKTMYITDFTKFYRTMDGGQVWDNLSTYLPVTDNAITYISVDEYDPRHIWITYGGYNNVKAFESVNGGVSWTDISNGLPPVPANTIIQNKLSKTQQLYAGTDLGVFFREGNGDWTLFSNKLPSVIVTELEIYYDKTTPENSVLYASTYGRGLWKSNLSDFEKFGILLNAIEGTYTVSNDSSALMVLNISTSKIFALNNSFTVYLSDKDGNLANPNEVGFFESSTSKIINAHIPSGTVSGKYYRVKVVSTNPLMESNFSNTFPIVLDNEAPTATISSSVNTSTSATEFSVNLVFNKDVNGFEQTDIVVSNAVINTFSSIKKSEYSIKITPQAVGVVTVDIPANKAYDNFGNWNSAATQWTISYTPTSVPTLDELGVKIFPNPTKGMLNIDFGKTYNNVEMVINDVVGNVVFKQIISNSSNSRFNLTQLPTGVYIVKLKIDSKEVVGRFVIE